MVAWQRFRFGVAGAAVFCAWDAAAQAQEAAPVVAQPSSAGDVAEQRMRAGDCVGALDAFDAAVRGVNAPELRRDRGKCHEKLGHPFPAIEDYRFYVTSRPDAPDAEAIRARVVALETQVGIVKSGQSGVSNKGGAAVSTSIGGETTLGEPGAGGAAGLETIEKNEQLESQAETSPLRRGTGLVLGLVVGGRYFGSSSLGGAELGGVDLRYSFSSASTLLMELTIGHANGSGTSSGLSGPGILGGYEFRLALDPRVNNAVLIGATFRYENLSESNGFVFAVLEPEGRVGFRHVFGPAFGLEAVLDGGAAFASITGLAGSGTTSALFGGHVGMVLGF